MLPCVTICPTSAALCDHLGSILAASPCLACLVLAYSLALGNFPYTYLACLILSFYLARLPMRPLFCVYHSRRGTVLILVCLTTYLPLPVTHTLNITLHYTCCYDEIKGTHAEPLIIGVDVV